MPRIGFPELAIILVIALIIFGPGKLPGLGKSVGETIKEFKKGSSDLMNVDKTEVKEDIPKEAKANFTPQKVNTGVSEEETKT